MIKKFSDDNFSVTRRWLVNRVETIQARLTIEENQSQLNNQNIAILQEQLRSGRDFVEILDMEQEHSSRG